MLNKNFDHRLCNWLITFTILTFTVTSQNYDLLSFSRDKSTLANCIRDHFNSERQNLGDKMTKELSEVIAEGFFRRTLSEEHLDVQLGFLIELLNIKGHTPLTRNQTLRTQWLIPIRRALLNCIDDDNVTEVSCQLNVRTLPYFVDDTPEFGLLLDYILVNWPYSLEHMIQTQRRRSLLRRFVDDALDIYS